MNRNIAELERRNQIFCSNYGLQFRWSMVGCIIKKYRPGLLVNSNDFDTNNNKRLKPVLRPTVFQSI